MSRSDGAVGGARRPPPLADPEVFLRARPMLHKALKSGSWICAQLFFLAVVELQGPGAKRRRRTLRINLVFERARATSTHSHAPLGCPQLPRCVEEIVVPLVRVACAPRPSGWARARAWHTALAGAAFFVWPTQTQEASVGLVNIAMVYSTLTLMLATSYFPGIAAGPPGRATIRSLVAFTFAAAAAAAASYTLATGKLQGPVSLKEEDDTAADRGGDQACPRNNNMPPKQPTSTAPKNGGAADVADDELPDLVDSDAADDDDDLPSLVGSGALRSQALSWSLPNHLAFIW